MQGRYMMSRWHRVGLAWLLRQTKICQEVGLPNANLVEHSKIEVKKYIADHHHREMKDEMTQYKKLASIVNEDFREAQSYMNKYERSYIDAKYKRMQNNEREGEREREREIMKSW